MAEMLLERTLQGTLAPVDDEAAERIRKMKVGQVVRSNIVQMRNYEFHKKFFALIRVLFDLWEETMPRIQYRGRDVLPNIDKFRRDLVILTGRYDATYNVRGEVQLEAHSISFANMEEQEFERLFSDVIRVALEKVLSSTGWTEEKVRHAVDQVLRFG